MQPEEVEKFLDKVMPKEGDTNENGTPSALALSRSGIPQVLNKPKKVDPTKELIWPDGHAPNLTLQQQEKIAEYLQKQRGGSHTAIALICRADDCQYNVKCPLYQMDPNLVPEGKPCPIELTLMEQWIADYRLELDIEDHQVVDLSILKEFVMWEVYKMRAEQELANDPKIVRREIVGVDQKGNPIYRDVMNPVFNMLDKQTRGKKKLLESLIATREAKAKADGSSSQTFSGFLAGLMEKVAEKKNAKNGKKLPKKNAPIIEAKPVKAIEPPKDKKAALPDNPPWVE